MFFPGKLFLITINYIILVYMERVKTGITGLDQLLQGGLPKGSSVLVSGGNGTGKTILSMQYIYEGARQFKEPGIFVSVESNAKSIAWDMQSFSWEIHSMQENDKISRELEMIAEKVREMNAKRLVIDSTTALAVWMEKVEFRPKLFDFLDQLKDLNCTTLFTSETRGDKTQFSAYGVEEFVADGVIALYFVPPNRSIFVRKMRGTGHSATLHPFEITDSGILIKPKEQVMWEAIK